MESLKNATVIVTGASSGIGKATALAVARRGANVVVADLDDSGAGAVVEQIEALGVQALAIHSDVGDDNAFSVLRDETLTEFGRVDVVMNNAGVLTRGLPEEIPVAEWERVLNINLMSVVRSNAVFLPILLEQGSGHLVNTASFAGLYSYAYDRTPYAASKAAIVQLSEALVLYLRPRGIGVTVLCPGPVETNIMASIRTFGQETATRGPGAQFGIKQPEEVGELVAEAIVANTFMLPTDNQVVDVLVDRARDWDGFITKSIAAWADTPIRPVPQSGASL
ncbi:short-chain dehydrogenase [Subtercola boreus]|uniref:Short-chain dehydrogenase n=1 Tax=Subtercola boreus TaxID=120213 RepID=A0A3E0VDE3_9MICO|nr:SDR family oxidoreductase [Subtercola boreus]RFA06897.1 short-chain dehydrogenase [Subtercola boreus]